MGNIVPKLQFHFFNKNYPLHRGGFAPYSKNPPNGDSLYLYLKIIVLITKDFYDGGVKNYENV